MLLRAVGDDFLERMQREQALLGITLDELDNDGQELVQVPDSNVAYGSFISVLQAQERIKTHQQQTPQQP